MSKYLSDYIQCKCECKGYEVKRSTTVIHYVDDKGKERTRLPDDDIDNFEIRCQVEDGCHQCNEPGGDSKSICSCKLFRFDATNDADYTKAKMDDPKNWEKVSDEGKWYKTEHDSYYPRFGRRADKIYLYKCVCVKKT